MRRGRLKRGWADAGAVAKQKRKIFLPGEVFFFACPACPACPIAPADGTGVGQDDRTGVECVAIPLGTCPLIGDPSPLLPTRNIYLDVLHGVMLLVKRKKNCSDLRSLSPFLHPEGAQ